ncbi:hypothetical protein NIES4071_75610 [Calothrix sp. NIES-4071]|nr:hypothetical protein NIES4071_75610 [Calothrix sp. NIES-4071]BAZ61836.1 hypothetical protein NIES4105_75560 [Calothrix sp. NIES-4105]
MLEKILLAIGLTFSLSIFTKINVPPQKHTWQQLESVNPHLILSQEARQGLLD